MRIGRERVVAPSSADEADVDAFVERLEEARERVVGELVLALRVVELAERSGARDRQCCEVPLPSRRLRRRRVRPAVGAVPLVDRRRESPRPMRRRCASAWPAGRRRCRSRRPCRAYSHSVTLPWASRPATKQSSLPLWPIRSQPQKQGMYFSTSGCRAANSYTALVTSGGRTDALMPGGSGGRSGAICTMVCGGGGANSCAVCVARRRAGVLVARDRQRDREDRGRHAHNSS